MFGIKPKKYIKNCQQLTNFQCNICMEVSEKPYICSGPCHMVLCISCINKIKVNYGKCPQRCTQNFDVEPCADVKIQFQCPFNKELCTIPLSNLAEFLMHLQKCEYVTEEWKLRQQNIKKYKCQLGHTLYFLKEDCLQKLYGYWNFYEKAIKSKCHQCQQVSLCRSICPQCSTKQKLVLFCHKCRIIPCTKTQCPHSHTLVQGTTNNFSNICDLCGKPCRMYGINIHRDTICNFDICQNCFQNLPEEQEIITDNMNVNVISHLFGNPALNSSDEQDSDSSEEAVQIIANVQNQLQNLQILPQINNSVQSDSSIQSADEIEDEAHN